MHDTIDEEFVVKLNVKTGKYQLEGRVHLIVPSRNPFFLAPYQADLRNTKDLYVDIACTTNNGFPYLLNMHGSF